MSVCRSTYQGDAALGQLLAKQGRAHDVGTVRRLLAGINAAALDRDDSGWLDLVAPGASPALAAQLAALRAELAEGAPADRAAPDRLPALRGELAQRGLSGFIVPRADEFQGEYVPQNAQRLAWLTGFQGSAGLAIVLAAKAAIFVDGRYTLQVRDQVDVALFEPRHISDQPASQWLAQEVRRGDRIGIDPRLHTEEQLDRFRQPIERAGGSLVEVESNPLDAIWTGRPLAPLGPVRPHDVVFAGRSSGEKRREIGAALAAEELAAVVLSAPDSIAWLLNIRGSDVPHTPLPLGYAILRADGSVALFMDPAKLVPGLTRHLGSDVSVTPIDGLAAALEALGKDGAKVSVDPGQVSAWVAGRLRNGGAQVVRGADPCALPKACKNEVELAGTRAAHRRDGAALTRFLAWLATASANGGLREIEASDRLEAFRRDGEHFRDLSFDSISGAGPNGAIVHYRASPETERALTPGELYLIDSGGQYLDGTTDVTRTVAIGTPSAEQRDRFTRVLKGHIALAQARFPAGTSGSQLDALARGPLWQAGLDYDHGTGHGVGSFLSVHEGPQRISKLPNTVALRPGMIVSNEPGYYKTGAYGIRIENLVAVSPLEQPAGAERDLLGFETLTLAPIDLALVEPSLLSAEEKAWLDGYHARVRDTIGPLVDSATRAWLEQATRPVSP